MSLGLFNSILASISITDKSESIDGLLLIKEHYPELSIPLKIKTLDGVLIINTKELARYRTEYLAQNMEFFSRCVERPLRFFIGSLNQAYPVS